MKTELFRKVQCSERLPGTHDVYYTEGGPIEYYSEYKEFGYFSEVYPDGPDEFIHVPMEWWLEPIEPVSMDQLNELIQPHAITLEHGEKAAQAIYDLIYGKEKEG